MTGISIITEARSIHWPGFVFSLIAASVLVLGVILLPLYAFYGTSAGRNNPFEMMTALSVVGTCLYLLIGTPVLIYYLRRHAADTARIVVLSLFSQLWLLPIGALLSLAYFNLGRMLMAVICMGFGVVGAPPLAFVFGLLYERFTPA